MNLPISVLDIQKFSRTSIFTVAISDILERTHRSCIDFLFSGSKLRNYDTSSKCLSENVLESTPDIAPSLPMAKQGNGLVTELLTESAYSYPLRIG